MAFSSNLTTTRRARRRPQQDLYTGQAPAPTQAGMPPAPGTTPPLTPITPPTAITGATPGTWMQPGYQPPYQLLGTAPAVAPAPTGPGASVPQLPTAPTPAAPPRQPPATGTEFTADQDAALEKWYTDRIAKERAAGRSTRVYELQLQQVYARQRNRPPTVPTPPDTTAEASRATRQATDVAAKRRRQAQGGTLRRSPLPPASGAQRAIRPMLAPRGLY